MKSLFNSIHTLFCLFFVNTVFGNEVPEDIIADPKKAVPPVMTERRKQFQKRRAEQNGEIFDDSIKTVEQEFKEKQAEQPETVVEVIEPEIIEPVKADEPEVVTDDAPVTVGDKEFPAEDFKEVIKDAQKHYGEAEFNALPETMQEKLILDRLNLKEGSKALNRKNMEAANQRKAAEKELEAKEAQLSETQESLQSKLEELNNKENDLVTEFSEKQQQIADLEKQIKAQQKLAEKAIDTEDMTIDEIVDAKQDQRDAKVAAEKLAREKSAAEERIKAITLENAEIWRNGLMASLQFHFPELETETAPEVVIGKAYKAVDLQDAKVVRRLARVANDYMNLSQAEQKNLTIAEYYEQEKDNYGTPIVREQKKETKKGDKPVNINVAEALKQHLKRQDGVPDPKGGKGGGHATVQTPETGAQMDRNKFQKNFKERMQKA
jgi:hypothetical protein